MTPVSDDRVYARIIGRITAAILVIGAAGSLAAIFARGWRFGLGVALGACVSYASFWRWRKLVDALGAGPEKRRLLPLMLRFGTLAGAAYAIIKYLEVNPVAVFLGLFVSAAAVIVSIVFELIYAGT